MSVAHLSTSEFGVMVAISVKLKLQPLGDACAMAELMSISNSAAYSAQYNDPAEHSSADDIEAAALRALTTEAGLLGHFGPVVYNCVTNSGVVYVGEIPASVAQSKETIAEWSRIEKACHDWQSTERKRIERQAEDDAAFADVGPLPILTAEALATVSASRKVDRVIYAEFRVNESESYTDYFGHRTARRVVIGFGTGKRESFKQLREAAATFEPTKDYGPGCDEYTIRAVWNGTTGDHFSGEPAPCGYNLDGKRFRTKAEVDAALAANDEQMILGTEYRVGCESLENRENYSMGGGNYLGSSRYGGWIVTSREPSAGVGMEYHEPPVAPRATRKAAKPRLRRGEKIDTRRRLDECCDAFQKQLRDIATACGRSVDYVFGLWCEYADQCHDQSAIVSEFIRWNVAKLVPEKPAPSTADCYAANV